MADLFSQKFDFNVPERTALEGRVGTAFFRKTASPTHLVGLILTQFSQRGVQGVKGEASDGRRFVFVDQKTTATFDADEVFLTERTSTVDDCIKSLSNGTVTRLFPKTIHPARCEAGLISDMAAKVREAWGGSFVLRQEEITNGEVTTTGLRPPQVGAIHAALAHWSVSNNPATIVMPTGTGKTETMLALATAVPTNRLLVVVPNDALRTQISEKFCSLGILPEFGLLPQMIERPVVAMLTKKPKTVDEVDQVFSLANVVVTALLRKFREGFIS